MPHTVTLMDETWSAEAFLLRIQAGEFDGRLYGIIENLSDEQLQKIVILATESSRSLGSTPGTNESAHDDTADSCGG